mmetsp:Transcript_5800/g.6689  ORF Transcript_5800/g.6689 Transcript_5800/m.6689 type:complete len:317 (+) Transcript_5800:147-1097(+)|eukprot:CAMPEP_0184012200 /NCGR_PEP_ID=MMETSP0954-20121128/4266_1 /TAXON_ID=627963 /ORGANISM="Aplanochytrium sp, Strain PBS07" /LENGTH=316 /DNA_ID=CAMNT_0026292133 /DNA_START=252 /DNA_END=1202 /DNA_ORIENTATION=-
MTALPTRTGSKKLSTILALPIGKKKISIDDVPIEDVVKGKAAFPLSTFGTFLENEQAEENLLFYRDVDDFKEHFEPGSGTEKPIVAKYIVDGSDYQINIPGPMRVSVVKQAENSADVKETIFDASQDEVLAVMASDKYPRFISTLKTYNLSDKLAQGAFRLGLIIFMIGLLISGIFIGIQFYAINELETRSSPPLETLNNRFWRFLAMPFLMEGIDFMVVAKTRLCPICATAGNNFSLSYGIELSYTRVIYLSIVEIFLKVRSPSKVISVDNQTAISEIAKANIRKRRKYTVLVIFLTFIVQNLIVMLPPDVPKMF